MKKQILFAFLSILLSGFCVGQTSTNLPLTQVNLPVTFDDPAVNYNLVDFGGNISSIVADPVVPSNNVCKVIKTNTAVSWAGTTIGGPAGLATAIPFAVGSTTMTMRVYSPDAGIPIRMKVEVVGDQTKSVETDALTTVANAWETLTFNFANPASGTAAINYSYTYKVLSVFFNFGTTGAAAGTKTYYCDDITFGAAPTQIDLPVTFDDPNVNYNLLDFGGNASSIVTDPVVSTNMVCKVIKPNTAETWAGTTIGGTTGFATAIPFAVGSTTMTMRVYSPDAGIPVRMKVEDPNDPTKSVETQVNTTVANAWETLSFNFANQASGTAPINYSYTYKKLSVFFNFGSTGATAGTNYRQLQNATGTYTGPLATNVDTISKIPNLIAGTISATQKIVSGNTPDLLNGTVPTGETSPTYQWQSSLNNITFTNISSANPLNYQPAALTSSTYYCDDITFGAAPTQVDLPVTFDDPNVNYNLLDFGGNASSIVTDPVVSTNMVCKVIKPNTAETWAGTTIGGTTGFATAIPFAVGSTTMTMRVYSPDAGIPVRMKVEDPNDPTKSVETQVNTTVANAWETLSFNFANQASGTAPINYSYTYKKLSVFFNFGSTGATAGTNYRQLQNATGTYTGPLATNVDTISKIPNLIAGTISATQKIVSGNTPDLLNGTVPTGETSPTYQWQSSLNNITFTNISSANPLNYQPAALTSSTYYCDDITFGGTAPSSVNIVFKVENPDSIPVYVFGSWSNWSNWPGDPMTSLGNNIYAATLSLPANSNFEFLYVNGNAPIKEVLNPAWSCTNGDAQYTYRVLSLGSLDTTICFEWATCLSCGSPPMDSIAVTFKVQNPDSIPVYVFGSWSNWGNWPGTPMASIGNDIYEATLHMKSNQNIEYLFVNGVGPTKEVLDPTWSCTNGNTQYTNRLSILSDADTTICFLWSTCSFCGTTSVNSISNDEMKVNLNENGIRVFSSTMADADQIGVFDMLGRMVYFSDKKQDLSNLIPMKLNSGSIYLITIKNNNRVFKFKGILME